MELGPRTQDALHAALGSERGQALWGKPLTDGIWDAEGDRHYGFDGEPVSMRVWAILFDEPSRILAQEWVLLPDCKRVWVSTVWLGIDHNYARHMRGYEGSLLAAMDEDGVLQEVDTRPWIFETMSFEAAKPGFFDIFARMGEERGQYRTATWTEALAAHKVLVVSTLSEEDDALPA